MTDIVLFSQAPADIQYVLSLYDKYKNKYSIKIIVVNVKNNFKFFKQLNLSVKLYFFPLIGYKNIVFFIKNIFLMNREYSILFQKMSKAKIYFFSNNYDYVTAFFIEKLQINNSIYFTDIYDINGKEINNTRNLLKKILVKLLLGINIKFFKIGDVFAYQYLYNKQYITKVVINIDNSRLEMYKYKVNSLNVEKEKLLLFESNGEQDTSFLHYKEDLDSILTILEHKYIIYIKAHPRLGYSKVLNKYKHVKYIEDFIPSELINTKQFSIILGIDSTAIATSRHSNIYSLLDIFAYKNIKRKEYLRQYLDKLSNGRINYIDNIGDVK